MNKQMILVVALMLASLSADAAILNGSAWLRSNCHKDAFCQTMSLVFSLPTVIVDGQDMDIDSQEASQRYVVEAAGDADPVLITHLSESTQFSVADITSAIQALNAQGAVVTASSIVAILNER